MKDAIQFIGGMLVVLVIPILLMLIWCDISWMYDALKTDIVLIAGILLVDKATDKEV